MMNPHCQRKYPSGEPCISYCALLPRSARCGRTPSLYRNTAPWLKPIGFRSALRSDVALTLHTYHAARIWTGRQKSDAKHSILGLSGFCAYVNRMHRGQHRTIRTPTGGWFRSKRKSRAAKPRSRPSTSAWMTSWPSCQRPSISPRTCPSHRSRSRCSSPTLSASRRSIS